MEKYYIAVHKTITNHSLTFLIKYIQIYIFLGYNDDNEVSWRKI